MILFVGENDKGYFVPEIAEKYDEKCSFSGFVSDLESLSKRILQGVRIQRLFCICRHLSLWIIKISGISVRISALQTEISVLL